MTGTVSAAISEEPVLRSTALASVTQNFVIIRNAERQSYTIIPVSRIARFELVKTPYQGLLAIAIGLFVLAIAAFASKQGDGAGIPIALLACFLLSVYFGSRRATITLVLNSGTIESLTGTVKDVVFLGTFIQSALDLASVVHDIRSRVAV